MTSLSLRILIVDDSRIFRSALEEALKGLPGVTVVGSVWSGEKALEFIQATPPDLVTLDLNMPGRGGLATLSDIGRLNAASPERPPIGVLIVSALTERGAAITVEGLARGAFDFLRKPEGPDERANAESLRRQMHEKIAAFRQSRRRSAGASPAFAPGPPASAPRPGPFGAVAIGSSTGGPQALARVLPELTRAAAVPVFLVQHLPAGMTHYFAESLARICSCPVVEAAEGMTVERGTVYLAPGGRHMVVRLRGSDRVIGLNDQPPENGCRPAADVLFRSVAVAYPRSVLAIVLTGMGTDGAMGLGPLKRSGAYILAQDEPSSVVWGMPGAAVATGHVDAVLPLDRIGPAAAALLAAGRQP